MRQVSRFNQSWFPAYLVFLSLNFLILIFQLSSGSLTTMTKLQKSMDTALEQILSAHKATSVKEFSEMLNLDLEEFQSKIQLDFSTCTRLVRGD